MGGKRFSQEVLYVLKVLSKCAIRALHKNYISLISKRFCYKNFKEPIPKTNELHIITKC